MLSKFVHISVAVIALSVVCAQLLTLLSISCHHIFLFHVAVQFDAVRGSSGFCCKMLHCSKVAFTLLGRQRH
jgi:hypothetical protein